MMLRFHSTVRLPHVICMIIYLIGTPLASTTTVTSAAVLDATPTTTSAASNGTCESRTINYITHSLTPICLTQRPSPSVSATSIINGSSETEDSRTTAAVPAQTSAAPITQAAQVESPTLADEDLGALDDASFLSFEDWKKQTLEKAGLEKAEQDAERRRKHDGTQETLDALGDDGEMDMDFGAFLGRRHTSVPPRAHDEASAFQESKPTGDAIVEAEKPRVRSKDAGKTWKERFNFASLDAGGQIMKANPEATSVSALLKENRDVYMLNTCQAKNKFLIVELSESILVETVAIANFEFFSSTFRQFRISVSDRYPQKPDKWVELGIFEARNTRDIQAFLIEDPRIWARYFRVEFLNHYGNEFYCPVSLLRVHGATMIQDILERGEEDGDDDDVDYPEVGDGERLVPEAVAEAVTEAAQEEKKKAESLKVAQTAVDDLAKAADGILSEEVTEAPNSSQIAETNLWPENDLSNPTTSSYCKPQPGLEELFAMLYSANICLVSDSPEPVSIAENYVNASRNEAHPVESRDASATFTAGLTRGSETQTSAQHSASDDTELKAETTFTTREMSSATSRTEAHTSNTPISVPSSAQDHIVPLPDKTSTSSAGHTNSHPPQPTTQESFFKLVSKRLQLLEANSTLSLKYIEEQSKILREAFTKVEKRQLTKTSSFLETLNSTVFAELLKFGQQYDQVWQSTVIELETQRDQLQRETAAVSVRLNILADELVFQKRMSIVQSILLLLCLGLVVFSRGLAGGVLDVPVIQGMLAKSRSTSGLEFESHSNSQAVYRGSSLRNDRPWRHAGHRRERSDESSGSVRSPSREDSPPTPYSNYSGLDDEIYDDDGQDDMLGGERRGSAIGPQRQNNLKNLAGESSSWHENEQSPGSAQLGSLPLGDRSSWLGDEYIGSNTPLINVQHFDDAQYTSLEGDRKQHIEGQPEQYYFGSSTHLPSPPPDTEKPEFLVARKPLPPLPEHNE